MSRVFLDANVLFSASNTCSNIARLIDLLIETDQHVAVWTQVLHGITVVAIYVVPPIYLNALARDHFRSSIQGL